MKISSRPINLKITMIRFIVECPNIQGNTNFFAKFAQKISPFYVNPSISNA